MPGSVNPSLYDGWWVELNVYFNSTDVRYVQPEDVQIHNMNLVFQYFRAQNWTRNAIAGMLGNMMVESSVNPWRFQHSNLDWNNVPAILTDNGGMGLTQWTPCRKYYNWTLDEGLDPKSGNSMCDRILYERNNNKQWSLDNILQYSWDDYVNSTDSPEILSRVFLYAYERPGHLPTPEQEADRIAQRAANARWCFENIGSNKLINMLNFYRQQNTRKGVKRRWQTI